MKTPAKIKHTFQKLCDEEVDRRHDNQDGAETPIASMFLTDGKEANKHRAEISPRLQQIPFPCMPGTRAITHSRLDGKSCLTSPAFIERPHMI